MLGCDAPMSSMLANDDAKGASSKSIAILIPCHNEELTVAEVAAGFRAELPEAQIYVFDNNSTDRTIERAQAAGAAIVSEPRQGKGFVVQSMFRRVEADVYVMVDGDGTYPASEVRRLIDPILKDEADMVVGSRLQTGTDDHVGLVFKNRIYQASYFGGRISAVAVNHHIDVGLDPAKH